MSDDVRERRSGTRRGRRRGTARVATLISWRDIPAQLTARIGDEQHKVLLHARFQHAIDRAAGVAGLTSTDDYVREWRSTSIPLADGDVAGVLAALGERIEAEHPRTRLEDLVAAGGLADQPSDPTGAGDPARPDHTDRPPTQEQTP